MKRNMISFGKLLTVCGLSTMLFVASCKEKERDFEVPCEAPAAPHASNNSPVAINSQIQFTAESIAGATYSWSGPAGFSSSEQNPVITFTKASQAGEYSVIITVNGCASEPGFTYVSSCNAAPAISISNSSRTDGTFVVGDTVSLNGAFNANATYRWSRPNGATDTLVQNFSIIGLKASQSGTYTFRMTLTNGGAGCTTPDSALTITIKPTKPKTSAIGMSSIGSDAATATYVTTVDATLSMRATETIASPGSSFKWSGPDGFSSTNDTITITGVTKAAEGTYWVHSIVNGVKGDSVSRKVIVKYANNSCGTDTQVVDAVSGQTYKIAQIAGRCWTKENIRKANGSEVFTWNEVNAVTVVDSQSVCPARWHVASDADYTALSTAVSNNGDALKDVIQVDGGGSSGTNTSGFTAKMNVNLGKSVIANAATPITSNIIKTSNTTGLTVGRLVKVTTGNGVLPPGTTITAVTSATQFTVSNNPTTALALGNTVAEQYYHAFFWTSTALSSNYVWYRQLFPDNSNILRNTQDLSVSKSYSVRCVRD